MQNRMRSSNEAKGIIPEPEIRVLAEARAAYRKTQTSSMETKANDNYNIRKFREDSSL